MFKDLIQTVGLLLLDLLFFWRYLKKSSENDQLVIFRAFLFFIFHPPTLNLKNNSRKSTYKKILALVLLSHAVSLVRCGT